jgi:hypothetical protein
LKEFQEIGEFSAHGIIVRPEFLFIGRLNLRRRWLSAVPKAVWRSSLNKHFH